MSTREQERQELYKTIWKIANDLRGSVDGWDFKSYVLGILFYRYLSESFTKYINQNEHDAGFEDFDYAEISDEAAETQKADLVATKGFFIYPSQLFCNVTKTASTNPNLNIDLKNIFTEIENSAQGTKSEKDFKGLFDDILVSSNKLGATVIERNKRLADVLNGIASMDLASSSGITDAFGDAYEFLMSMYASNAGKSGGEYYTPPEVSELLARITLIGKDSVNKVYDPACGSGSLLLKFLKIIGKDKVKNGFYGQEKNITTYNLCRINMFLHSLDSGMFDIACGDTLTDPKHWDNQPFDAIVSNPPYSIKWAGSDDPTLIGDDRFAPAGVLAPKSKADMAFIMHCLSWLSNTGTAAIVCFPGIFYRNGAEQKIRKYLIDNNYVEAVIQLAPQLFFGTSISTCILVLKKSKIDNKVLFIDASGEFEKVTNSNKLNDENIQNILNMLIDRKNIDYKANLVDAEAIEAEDYNLSVSTYVEQEDTSEKIDIVQLNKEIKDIVAREDALRKEIDAIIADLES